MQHILFPPLKKRCSTRKNELFFLECFVGTVFFFFCIYMQKLENLFAHIHESVLIMVCDVNACYYFFFSMLLCLSVKEKRTWSVKLIRISIFLLTSAFVNKIIWVFLKLCRNTLFFHFAIHLEFCGSSLIVFHSLQQGCWYRLLVGLKVAAASWWCTASVVRLWSSHCEPSLNHKA